MPQRGQTILGELRRRIVLNELPPGSVLTELALAAELGSSQSSIREALLRLEGEGLVTRSGHQGTTVTDLHRTEAAEILGLRRRIEGRAARVGGAPDDGRGHGSTRRVARRHAPGRRR